MRTFFARYRLLKTSQSFSHPSLNAADYSSERLSRGLSRLESL